MQLASILAALAMLAFAPTDSRAQGSTQSTQNLRVTCSQPQPLQNAQPAYVPTLSDMLRQRFPGATVNCTSCYRTPDQQRAACNRICGADRCPGRCAAPGRSQHQRQQVATCDLSGIRGNIPDVCRALRQLCDQRYGGRCGIGGYPSGAFHFGVNDGHFSSWNQCAFLRNEAGNPQPGEGPAPGSADDLQALQQQTQRAVQRYDHSGDEDDDWEFLEEHKRTLDPQAVQQFMKNAAELDRVRQENERRSQ